MPQSLIKLTEDFVRKQLEHVDGSHDFLHIDRVRRLALTFASTMDPSAYFVREDLNALIPKQKRLALDLELLEMAALLHDVGDFKYSLKQDATDHLVSQFLTSVSYPSQKSRDLLFIINNMSFRKELERPEFFERELQEACCSRDESALGRLLSLAIVQDADRVDAIGAIGVARCFVYGASKGHPFYDAASPPLIGLSHEQYNAQTASNKGNPVNHFYEKLFTLRSNIKTTVARVEADQRHAFMVAFLRQFEHEANLPSYLDRLPC